MNYASCALNPTKSLRYIIQTKESHAHIKSDAPIVNGMDTRDPIAHHSNQNGAIYAIRTHYTKNLRKRDGDADDAPNAAGSIDLPPELSKTMGDAFCAPTGA